MAAGAVELRQLYESVGAIAARDPAESRPGDQALGVQHGGDRHQQLFARIEAARQALVGLTSICATVDDRNAAPPAAAARRSAKS
jgi:hypothetical protein